MFCSRVCLTYIYLSSPCPAEVWVSDFCCVCFILVCLWFFPQSILSYSGNGVLFFLWEITSSPLLDHGFSVEFNSLWIQWTRLQRWAGRWVWPIRVFYFSGYNNQFRDWQVIQSYSMKHKEASSKIARKQCPPFS